MPLPEQTEDPLLRPTPPSPSFLTPRRGPISSWSACFDSKAADRRAWGAAARQREHRTHHARAYLTWSYSLFRVSIEHERCAPAAADPNFGRKSKCHVSASEQLAERERERERAFEKGNGEKFTGRGRRASHNATFEEGSSTPSVREGRGRKKAVNPPFLQQRLRRVACVVW